MASFITPREAYYVKNKKELHDCIIIYHCACIIVPVLQIEASDILREPFFSV